MQKLANIGKRGCLKLLVLDSGLGGLSVVRALRAASPGISVDYLADTGGFPYGARGAEWVRARADTLMDALGKREKPTLMVVACNTLSTLALDHLRQHWKQTFVGTVPAIKVAAEQTKSRRFTLLATPNTAQSAYTNGLITEFASHCVVDCYGAPNLAQYAERILLGESIPEEALAAEIAPAFLNDARGKTDMIILGCTHYPLIIEQLSAAAPWQIGFIDASPAIARRALSQANGGVGHNIAYVTREEDVARYRALFANEGFDSVEALAV